MDNINSPELSPQLKKHFITEQPVKIMNDRIEETQREFEAMRRMDKFFNMIEIGGTREIEEIKFIIDNDPLK